MQECKKQEHRHDLALSRSAAVLYALSCALRHIIATERLSADAPARAAKQPAGGAGALQPGAKAIALRLTCEASALLGRAQPARR